MKQINVTEHETNDFNQGDFVICDNVIGFITEIIQGQSNKYARISWLDGATTEHVYNELTADGVKRAIYSENLPSFAR